MRRDISVPGRVAALVVAAVLASLIVSARPAAAGGITACDSPFIFNGSAANIVPLEYLATTADASSQEFERQDRLQATAQRLSWLFKLDSWHQPTYGSLGVVAHMFLGHICDPDEVIGQLLIGGASPPLNEGQILVFLQGRMFIEDDQIFLQSRLRGFRRQSPQDHFVRPLAENFAQETLAAGLSTSNQPLTISLPVLDLTFAPRVVSEDLFARIDSAFLDASRVFARPDLNASGEELVFYADQPQAFSVRFADKPGWIEVEDVFGGSPASGFIRVNPDASQYFHRSLPELDFLNGVLGFLRLQQARASDDFAPVPEGGARQAIGSLQNYLENELTADEPELRALAHGLIGFIQASEMADWPAARTSFLHAAEAAPTESHYRNALGVTDAMLCCSDGGPSPYRDPARWFADSVSVDPENGEALGNLLHFLEFLASTDEQPEGVDTSNLPRTLEVVRQVAEQNPDLIEKDR